MRHKDWLSRPKKTKSLAAMEKNEKHPGYQVDPPEDFGVSSTTLWTKEGWLKAYSRIISRSSAWFHVVKPLCTLWLRYMRSLLPRERKTGSRDWGTPGTSEDRHSTLKMGLIRQLNVENHCCPQHSPPRDQMSLFWGIWPTQRKDLKIHWRVPQRNFSTKSPYSEAHGHKLHPCA